MGLLILALVGVDSALTEGQTHPGTLLAALSTEITATPTANGKMVHKLERPGSGWGGPRKGKGCQGV